MEAGAGSPNLIGEERSTEIPVGVQTDSLEKPLYSACLLLVHIDVQHGQ